MTPRSGHRCYDKDAEGAPDEPTAVALTDRLVAPDYATLDRADGRDLLDLLHDALRASGLAGDSS